MDRIVKLWNQPWINTIHVPGAKHKQFKSFATKFKNDLTKELALRDATITKFAISNYTLHGFFRTKENNCFYFAISDVRFVHEPTLLYRVAKNENDYKGGINRYIEIENGMANKMNLN